MMVVVLGVLMLAPPLIMIVGMCVDAFEQRPKVSRLTWVGLVMTLAWAFALFWMV